MSLETAGFIKDLVSTNPEGTDPKSQGDDHLRMIKAVLKAQFSGLTQGKAITLTEDNINLLGGGGSIQVGNNIDTPVPYTHMRAIVASSTGTLPPGGVAGHMILHVTYNNGLQYQMAFVFQQVFTRRWNGAVWSAWVCITPMGIGQSWQDVSASRALNTDYTNSTPQTIMVSAVINGQAGSTQAFINGGVGGVTTCLEMTNDANGAGAYLAKQATIQLIVPPGTGYRLSSTGPNVIGVWRELRA